MLSLILIVLLLLLGTIYWYATIPRNLPPGPIGVPLFGSMFQTRRAAGLHWKLLNWTKIYGPLYKLYVADKLVVVLGSWEMIQEALVKQGDNFASRPPLHTILPSALKPGAGLVNSDGELWKIQRRFALSTLRDFGLGRPLLEPKIKEETEHLIEAIDLEKTNPFDPGTLLNNAVSNVICALVFGHRFQYEDEKFRELLSFLRSRLTESNVNVLTPFVLSKKVATLMRHSPRIKKILAEANTIADFAKAQIGKTMEGFDPTRDEATNYVQAFYKAKEEKQNNWTFTDAQLLASVSNLFIAGTDTTATTLRWGLFFLAHHPEWQDRLYSELKASLATTDFQYADRTKLPLIEATIMETQRMANLAPLGLRRRNVEKTTLAGYDIPADTVIVPLLTAALRDPEVYPNPHKYDPMRFVEAKKQGDEKNPVFTHLIPFQAGKRICLGESMARMELFLFFTTLVANYKFHFNPTEPSPPEDGENVSLIRAPPKFRICAVRRTN